MTHTWPSIEPTILQVPFRHYLSHQFSVAYDVYLNIVRHVNCCIDRALGRDLPDW